MTRHRLFALGEIVATANVLTYANQHGLDLLKLLNRHQHGDWGDLCDEDKASNEAALTQPLRILSSYLEHGEKVWIITEADRSMTTILLAQDY
ncbi:hypothetical protein [Acinetobacter rathckeae]|uniref:hypothetical protein n=1 Tax=Acinetobacter rathckeae TaxID=2605272 RepID=UPI0018A28C16|nr:hypothetical protein [Acinetobacter rathckeae]MBF7687698.1 hypothetical protein [Acinetobacter rathckeae]